MIEKYKLEIAELLKLDKVNIYMLVHSHDDMNCKSRELKQYDMGYIKDSQGLRLFITEDDIPEGKYFYEIMYQSLASFTLIQLPGCCGICVSTASCIFPKYRNKGLGKLLNKFREDIAKTQGYTILLCTDQDRNIPQRKILEANGWKDIYKFVNKRTDNLLNITIKEL